jgi:hypothetical protein
VGPQIEFDPKRIEQHADELRDDIGKKLEKVMDKLNQDKVHNLEGGSFSITCTMAAMAYPGAVQYGFENLRTYMDVVKRYADQLDTTAQNYRRGDDSSTVRTTGV